MGNNKEIRARLDIYRSILIALVWIGAVIGAIAGFVMMGSYFSSFAFG